MMLRALVGALAAGLVTARARVTGSLGPSGQWAAFALGVLSAVASWGAAVTLVAFYVGADLVTRWRAEEKMRTMIASVPQAKLRDATQVFANGAVFVLFALVALKHPNPRWTFAALGALAAASADSWATEIGTIWGGTPHSLTTWRPMRLGMSGGVTTVGTLASAAGALFVAVAGTLAFGLHGWRTVVVVAGAGVAGAFVDSLVGDTLQSKRWCDRCLEWTERRVHPCGYRTKHRRGIIWLTNDLVNFICTGAGGVAAVFFTRLLFPPH